MSAIFPRDPDRRRVRPGSCLLEWSFLRLLCHQFEKLPWVTRRAGHSAFLFVCLYIDHTKIFCSQKSRFRDTLEGEGHPLGSGFGVEVGRPFQAVSNAGKAESPCVTSAVLFPVGSSCCFVTSGSGEGDAETP